MKYLQMFEKRSYLQLKINLKNGKEVEHCKILRKKTSKNKKSLLMDTQTLF
jgi:hypothetical protein